MADQCRPLERPGSWIAAMAARVAEPAYVLGGLACGALTAYVRNAAEGGGLYWATTVATGPLVGLLIGAWQRRQNPDSNVLSWMFWSALTIFVLNAADAMGL